MGATQELSGRLATVRLLTTGETFAWVASVLLEPLTPHVQKRARKRLAFSVGARKKRTVPFGRFAFLQGQASSRHAAVLLQNRQRVIWLILPVVIRLS